MSDSAIIESIDALTFKVRVRDRVTNEVHEVELRGRGPWDLATLERVIADKGASAKPRSLPPPDDAITLKLDNRDGKGVRVAATGSGAKAWTASQGTLLGAKWFIDARGAPVVLLEDSPSILADIENALPDVTIEHTHYVDHHADGTVVVAAATPRERAAQREKPKLAEAREVADKPARRTAPEPATRSAGRPARDPATEPAPKVADKAPSKPAPEPAPKVSDTAASKPASERASKSTDGKRSRARADSKQSKPREQLAPGLGAGNLTWQETGDAESPGIVAEWKDGQFKILHAGGDVYALFYEHDRAGSSGYDRIACGPVDALKILAGERTVTDFRPEVDLQAARRLCGVVEPKAQKPDVEPAPAAPEPPPAEPPGADPDDEVEAGKQAMGSLKALLEDMS